MSKGTESKFCNIINYIWNSKKLIFEFIGIVIIIWTLILTKEQLVLTNEQLLQSEKLTKETYLTGLWNDIAKESINYPEFQIPDTNVNYTKNYIGEDLIKYNNYVRWIGGFLEDLFHHKFEENDMNYFKPTVDSFLNLHCRWFKDHIEYYYHTPGFYNIINDLKCND